MPNHNGRPDFDALYREAPPEQDAPALIPWDIGGPQPVVQQLVAYGAVRGEVLDPGTGPGHHAIYYASKGYSATGIDASPAAIERAERNAERAGVRVNFEVADATELDGLEGRFDTVVDSAFYHVFLDDEQTQAQYAQALHRATKPGARLFMFEVGRHNVNGLQPEGLPAENFDRVLPAAGWRIDHLGTTTYQATFSPETFAHLAHEMSDDSGWEERMKPMQEQLQIIAPLLKNNRVHMPVWAVTATRLD
ncbi:class I SAM-dependent methyltransferase [Nocardia brevicatena]|uniref:class I SAM-dependent methyltransferase n=1 Tax=Nocardia brevicatena TaxID=37327 RepID=UPI000A05A638|nr:class I SAM-dependent methyltransferase [Nocardia brevicatena]